MKLKSSCLLTLVKKFNFKRTCVLKSVYDYDKKEIVSIVTTPSSIVIKTSVFCQ